MGESLTLARRGAALVRDWRFSAALIVLVIATLGIPVMAIDFSELSEFFDTLTGEARQELKRLVALVLGDSRSFELRRGGLDFYQVNMRPVYAEQREFYSAR